MHYAVVLRAERVSSQKHTRAVVTIFLTATPPPEKKDIKHNQQTTAHIPTRLNLKNLQADRPKRLLL